MSSTSIYWKYTPETHTLTFSSNTIVDGNGSFPSQSKFTPSTIPWVNYKEVIQEVEFLDVISPYYLNFWFYYCKNLTTFINLQNLDTSNVLEMKSTFYKCESLISLDLSTFDTHNTTSMAQMFALCTSLRRLDVSRFDTSQVVDMSSMFNSCDLISLDLSNFNTINVTYMSGMFEGMTNVRTIYVSDRFVTSAVEESYDMFDMCTNLVGAISYDPTKRDATYANYTTGYFTYKAMSKNIRMQAKAEAGYDILHPRTLAQYISYDNSQSGLKAINVRDAIEEIYGYPNTWQTSTMPSKANWKSVCYGGDRFVAIAYGSNKAAYSTNGINWTASTLPSTANWCSICYGNGKFVAVADNSNQIAYSTNGSSWTAVSTTSGSNHYAIAYGSSRFITVGSLDNHSAYSISVDGISWSGSFFDLPNEYFTEICYGNNIFIVIDSVGNYWKRDNNNRWNRMGSLPINTKLCYGYNKFIAAIPLLPKFRYQEGTYAWRDCNNEVGAYNWIDIVYGAKQFIAINNDSTSIACSIDGINWQNRTLPSQLDYSSICYGQDKFVIFTSSNSNTVMYTMA